VRIFDLKKPPCISEALALNIGSDSWELTQVASAYAAAKSLGTGFKQFLSLDFTAMGCTLSNIVSIVNTYDTLALNIGSDSWELTQVANAYAAAKSLGTGFKLFLSLDFTAMGCMLSNIVSIVNTYANHPNQFKFNGKTMISSYEGGRLGNAGWQSLKQQTNGCYAFYLRSRGAFRYGN
jgi:Glycosyl hydrolase family 71